MASLLLSLPDDLLALLVSDWIDPETDLRGLVSKTPKAGDLPVEAAVLPEELFRSLVARRGVVVRATKVLSESCLAWLAAHGVRVDLWKTDRSFGEGSGHAWYCNGQLHRDGDLPAVVWRKRIVDAFECYLHMERHDNQLYPYWYPSLADESCWYQHGKLHRDGDRPAVVRVSDVYTGFQGWYQHGQRHRDGQWPAVVWGNGTEERWLFGHRIP